MYIYIFILKSKENLWKSVSRTESAYRKCSLLCRQISVARWVESVQLCANMYVCNFFLPLYVFLCMCAASVKVCRRIEHHIQIHTYLCMYVCKYICTSYKGGVDNQLGGCVSVGI